MPNGFEYLFLQSLLPSKDYHTFFELVTRIFISHKILNRQKNFTTINTMIKMQEIQV